MLIVIFFSAQLEQLAGKIMCMSWTVFEQLCHLLPVLKCSGMLLEMEHWELLHLLKNHEAMYEPWVMVCTHVYMLV